MTRATRNPVRPAPPVSAASTSGARRGPGDGGYTLVEVVITSAILLVVLGILAPLLTGTLTTFGRQSDRSGALDQAGLALQQMEHDVLGSSVINVVSPGNDLQLIVGQVGSTRCVEYMVTTGAAPQPLVMQRRTRVAGAGTAWPSGGGWQTMFSTLKVSGQSAGTVIPNPGGANPFTIASSLRTVNIDLQVQNGTAPINELKTAATGRTVTATTAAAAAAAYTAQCS